MAGGGADVGPRRPQGGGFDCFVAARLVGPIGAVIGVDMTPAMLERSRRVAERLRLANVEFREGILEDLPVDDGWADVVISNGVLNLVADKPRALAEARRVLRPGGVLQVADIAVGREWEGGTTAPGYDKASWAFGTRQTWWRSVAVPADPGDATCTGSWRRCPRGPWTTAAGRD